MSTSKLIPDSKYIEAADDSDFADAFARIECHYFVNGIFLEDEQILRDVEKIKHIPTEALITWAASSLLPEPMALATKAVVPAITAIINA